MSGTERIKERVTSLVGSVKTVFRSLSLRTQLLFILLFLLLISIGSLTFIYTRTEDMLLDKVSENIDDITKAIEISVEELTYGRDSTERLKSYVDMLNRKGIREISIISDTSEVIASSDPKKIGTKQKVTEKRPGRKKDLIIRARLGEEHVGDTQRLYNIIMPVSIQGQNIGYVHIIMALDDYRLIQDQNHLKRILSMIFAFAIGIIICLFIANEYTEPIKKIANASRNIAMGELVRIRVDDRKDEIGTLVKSFNEMVDKLREQKKLEEKLKKSEQLSLIGQLSSGIAHEIRNPLNFMSLSIGHIKERLTKGGMSGNEELLRLLDDLLGEIYRVNNLIHNFLVLGKPVTLRKEQVSLETLVNEALYMVKDKIREDVNVKVTCANGNGKMFCDREYMRICVINLIINAGQAIQGVGAIHIECGIEDIGVYISVTDNGEGISNGELDRIFEPYYSTKKLGIGLGLAITKRFVEEHGGTIDVVSKARKGTTMTIRVPGS